MSPLWRGRYAILGFSGFTIRGGAPVGPSRPHWAPRAKLHGMSTSFSMRTQSGRANRQRLVNGPTNLVTHGPIRHVTISVVGWSRSSPDFSSECSANDLLPNDLLKPWANTRIFDWRGGLTLGWSGLPAGLRENAWPVSPGSAGKHSRGWGRPSRGQFPGPARTRGISINRRRRDEGSNGREHHAQHRHVLFLHS